MLTTISTLCVCSCITGFRYTSRDFLAYLMHTCKQQTSSDIKNCQSHAQLNKLLADCQHYLHAQTINEIMNNWIEVDQTQNIKICSSLIRITGRDGDCSLMQELKQLGGYIIHTVGSGSSKVKTCVVLQILLLYYGRL